jgi:surfeit locus 1 family protein
VNAVQLFAVRRRAALVLIAALAGVLLTARLGVWQLDRAAQKLALQQSLNQREAMPELPAAELTQDARQAKSQEYRRIRLRGQWMDGATVFLDNRQMNGRPGFYVVTPLRLEEPRGMTVLVQRGWAPRDQLDRTRLPVLPAAGGDTRVVGHVAPPPSRLFEFDAAASGPIRQNLDPATFGREIGVTLASFSVVQDAPPVPDDGLLRQWPHPAVDVQMHYGYAFQWFALCALMAGLYVWFQLVRPRLKV